MTMVSRDPLQDSLREQQLEQVRMHDLRLILDQLIHRESTTAKAIIDCLYDIGSVHLINQKVSHRCLNRLTKRMAKVSKPVFRLMALRWFKKNGAEALAEILRKEVSFQKQQEQPEQPPQKPMVQEQPLKPVVIVEDHRLPPAQEEVRRLRTQVNRLAGVAIATTAALTGTIALASYRLDTNPVQLFLTSPPSQNQDTTSLKPR